MNNYLIVVYLVKYYMKISIDTSVKRISATFVQNKLKQRMEISIDSFGRKCILHIRCLSRCMEISIDTWWSRLSAAFVQRVTWKLP